MNRSSFPLNYGSYFRPLAFEMVPEHRSLAVPRRLEAQEITQGGYYIHQAYEAAPFRVTPIASPDTGPPEDEGR